LRLSAPGAASNSRSPLCAGRSPRLPTFRSVGSVPATSISRCPKAFGLGETAPAVGDRAPAVHTRRRPILSAPKDWHRDCRRRQAAAHPRTSTSSPRPCRGSRTCRCRDRCRPLPREADQVEGNAQQDRTSPSSPALRLRGWPTALSRRRTPRGRRLAILSLAALGVVYGDIGTPLDRLFDHVRRDAATSSARPYSFGTSSTTKRCTKRSFSSRS
jgi:hypothetical protein